MFSAVTFGDAMNKGLTIHTNQCPVKRQWPRLWSHIHNGYLKPNEIVSQRIRSSTLPRATTFFPPNWTT